MYMGFIDENTAFAKKRTVNKTLHKRAGFYAKDEYGYFPGQRRTYVQHIVRYAVFAQPRSGNS